MGTVVGWVVQMLMMMQGMSAIRACVMISVQRVRRPSETRAQIQTNKTLMAEPAMGIALTCAVDQRGVRSGLVTDSRKREK